VSRFGRVTGADFSCILWLQGYRDCIAWLLKNGKIPYGVADADVSDTADSAGEVPGWRRKLQDTLASVQAQVTGCDCCQVATTACLPWCLQAPHRSLASWPEVDSCS
jgi:hypothetical protein